MKKSVLLTLTVFLAGTALHAQHFQGAHFLDGYHYSYRLNPAVTPDADIRTGLLNTLSVETRSNIGVGNFIFPVDGHLATGLNRHVSASDFLENLPMDSEVIANLDVGLFARGFRRGGNYHTIELNVRSNNVAVIPYDLMAFLKLGASERESSYDLSSFHASSGNYLELAYGLGRSAGNIRYGFRIKPLIGISNLDARFNRFDIDMTVPDFWSITSQAEIEIAGNQFTSRTRGEKEEEVLDPGGIDFKLFRPGFAGLGIAADLGVQWQVSKYLSLGLSVLDLGMLKWFDKVYARTPEMTFQYDPSVFTKAPKGNRDTSANLGDIAKFYVRDKKNSLIRLPMTVSATARMKMPFYDRLSVAASGTLRNGPDYTILAGRLFTVWSPWEWFSANISCGRDRFGWSGGAAAIFTTKEFSFFVGTDSYIFRVTPQMIPAGKANLSLTFGVSHAL